MQTREKCRSEANNVLHKGAASLNEAWMLPASMRYLYRVGLVILPGKMNNAGAATTDAANLIGLNSSICGTTESPHFMQQSKCVQSLSTGSIVTEENEKVNVPNKCVWRVLYIMYIHFPVQTL